MNTIDVAFVNQVEMAHFRTTEDTGANANALFIWNIVRDHVGLPPLSINDLHSYCVTHKTYHAIKFDYGCKRKE